MWQPVWLFLRGLGDWGYRRSVRRALALHSRGEARADGLTLLRIRNRLQIQWRSRDVHPWDLGVAPEQRAAMFHEQLVADTEAAILRLFQALPQIDRIDLQVLEPNSESVVLAGTVNRSALISVRSLPSVRMRLQLLGVNFCALDSLQ